MGGVQKKKVSIITATYNLIDNGRKDSFNRMFNSIHEQRYPNIEHLIIDGVSDDDTLEMIEKLISVSGAQNVRIISEPDTGIYNAFNKGVKKSSGDYVIFMNSDDSYYDCNSISLLVDMLESGNADFSCGSASVIEGKNDYIWKPDLDLLPYTMPLCHQAMLCKRELFDEIDYFDEAYKLASDYKFLIKLLKLRKKYIFSNSIIVYFSESGASVTDFSLARSEALVILINEFYDSILTKKEKEKLLDNDFSTYLFFKIYIRSKGRNKYFLKILKNKCLFFKNKFRYYTQLRFLIKPIETYIKAKKGIM